jgi:hypothetical protein
MAIVDSQNSKSVPTHLTTSSVPQGSLEELQVQEEAFVTEVKSSLAVCCIIGWSILLEWA